MVHLLQATYTFWNTFCVCNLLFFKAFLFLIYFLLLIHYVIHCNKDLIPEKPHCNSLLWWSFWFSFKTLNESMTKNLNLFCSVCACVSAFGKVSKFRRECVCMYFYHAFVWYFVWYSLLLLCACVCVCVCVCTVCRNVTEVCLTHRFPIYHVLPCLVMCGSCLLSNAWAHVYCMWPCVQWVCAVLAGVGVVPATLQLGWTLIHRSTSMLLSR